MSKDSNQNIRNPVVDFLEARCFAAAAVLIELDCSNIGGTWLRQCLLTISETLFLAPLHACHRYIGANVMTTHFKLTLIRVNRNVTAEKGSNCGRWYFPWVICFVKVSFSCEPVFITITFPYFIFNISIIWSFFWGKHNLLLWDFLFKILFAVFFLHLKWNCL